MAGASAQFKAFLDATSSRWAAQRWKDKLAAGFTNSAGYNGDKLNTLQQFNLFAMQHGMLWVGNPFLPEQHQGVPFNEAVNRLGSWSGLMAQAGHGSAAHAFVPGDIKTARLFGQHFAETVDRVVGVTS